MIGALLDAGGDFEKLKTELKKLSITDEYELQMKKVVKNGISSTKFDVVLKNDHTDHEETAHDDVDHHHTHSHDEHAHHTGHEDDVHSHDSHHHHGHEGVHSHHSHHHHGHHHAHRAYRHIVQMIETADFNNDVKHTALEILKKIGEAEARIHGMELDNVHFHEVGAVDSIIDIVGTAILMDQLGIEAVKSAAVPVGSGKIHIDHGVYPVPAPATLEILKGVPIQKSELKSELTTPTGAGIVAVMAEAFENFPTMKVDTIGYGAGTKTFPDHPNVLRVVIGA